MTESMRKAVENGRERAAAARATATELQARVKPRLRGAIHGWAFPFSLLAGALLVVLVADSGTERLALGVYAASLSALLGTSALYHRVDWKRARARMWMRRLDHSMIFLLIAGTVTPFAVLVLDGTIATAVLVAVWAAALAGIVVQTIWVHAPKGVSAAVYVGVGSLGAIAMPAIVAEAGFGAGLLIAVGGVLYIAGAVIYARQRPDPRPAVFGYHEIFHLLVVAAASAHFAAVALYADAGPAG
jgi:hemolysin III